MHYFLGNANVSLNFLIEKPIEDAIIHVNINQINKISTERNNIFAKSFTNLSQTSL